MQYPCAGSESALILRHLLHAGVALALAGTAHAQVTQAIIQQPFGQKPPPPPPPQQQQQLDREHHRLPGWLYRGLVAGAGRADEAVEIDTPVTGYGNEALWDVPRLAPLAVAATAKAQPPTQPKVAAARLRR